MASVRLLLLAASAATTILASPLLGSSPGEQLSPRQGGGSIVRGQCGWVICGPGLYCCNPTCSMCMRPNEGCIAEDCGHLDNPPPIVPLPTSRLSTPGSKPPRPTTATAPVTAPSPTITISTTVGGPSALPTSLEHSPPAGVPCGKNVCKEGMYCCNSSCGICAPKGGACIMLYCKDGRLPGSD